MFHSFRKLIRLLSFREKRGLIILIFIMISDALIEVVSVAIIPAYITALAYPEKIRAYPVLQSVLHDRQDEWLTNNDLLIWGSGLLLLFFSFKTGFNMFSTYWRVRFSHNRALKLSQRLFTAYMQAPYTFHLNQNTSELLRNINGECSQLANNVLIPIVDLISHTIILLGIVLLLVYAVPIMVLVWLAFFLGAGVGIAAFFQLRVKHLGQDAQRHRAIMVKAVNEGLGGVKETKVLGRSWFFVERFRNAFARTGTIQCTMHLIQQGMPAFIELLSVVGLFGVTVMLILGGKDTQTLIATLSVFAVALARMKGIVRSIMHNYTMIRHHSPSLDVVYDGLQVLEQRPAGRIDRLQTQPLTSNLPLARQIELIDISYRYPNTESDALRHIHLNIKRGEAVGFVGATGAGKSTLLDLFLGILTPTTGRILVDGQNIQEHLADWHLQLGYIPQAIFLIDGTVIENIAFGDPPEQADPHKIERAAEAAALSPLIARLPNGFETVIGERGIRLSGGERQRIAIARALYRNPDILVMDEATSALDNVTESAVINAVVSLKGNRTILMIAHRLSTVRRCDRIIFLKNGEIDAVGSYRELEQNHHDFQVMASH